MAKKSRGAATRKAQKTRKGKSSKGRKGTRKLSPALKAWNERVMKKFREMRKTDPSVKLRDAMMAAKRDSA
jgi:hypothetical protein